MGLPGDEMAVDMHRFMHYALCGLLAEGMGVNCEDRRVLINRLTRYYNIKRSPNKLN
jgi:hypothetical protein